MQLFECLLERIWKSVLTTPNVEDKIGLYEAFERNYEMELVMKFDQCVCSSSLNLVMYFFRSRMANCFWCYLGKYLHLPSTFRKYRKDCNILKTILV